MSLCCVELVVRGVVVLVFFSYVDGFFEGLVLFYGGFVVGGWSKSFRIRVLCLYCSFLFVNCMILGWLWIFFSFGFYRFKMGVMRVFLV